MLISECVWHIIAITTVLQEINAKSENNSGIKKKEKTDNKITGALTIGVTGIKPFFSYDGSIKGSDNMILQLLSKKLGFQYNLTIVNNFDIMVKMVRL